MPTGRMRYFISVLLLAGWLAAAAAGPRDVALIGVIGDKAAVLAIDGGEPKTVKVGQKWNGVSVISVEKDRTTVEIDGKTRVLQQGQHYRGTVAASDHQSATLAANTAGHFLGEGSINGVPVRFLVDTGASAIALSGAEAQRMGLDYRKGRRGAVQTANGVAVAYYIRLDTVKVGAIELSGVDAMVIEQGLNVALLGMSFLNRVEMRRDGETMTLTRRF
jgi:aspartyl protease family protein